MSRYNSRRYANRYRSKSKKNPSSKPKGVTLNKQGGAEPKTTFELVRARAVDLVTLPRNISGTRCNNCKWWSGSGKIGFCQHPLIKMTVTDRQCCAAWDNRGVIRPKKVAK